VGGASREGCPSSFCTPVSQRMYNENVGDKKDYKTHWAYGPLLDTISRLMT
jgi:hypothetical protein